MLAIKFDPQHGTASDLEQTILTHDVAIDGRTRLRKGAYLSPADLPILREYTAGAVHLVRPEAGEIPEEVAGQRLAAAVAGSGVTITGPVEGRYNALADTRGLLRFDRAAMQSLNEIPDISIFTLFDSLTVEANTTVAGIKVTPLITREPYVAQAEALASTSPGVIRVLPFQPLKVGVVIKEALPARERERVVRRLGEKIAWYGGTLLAVAQVEDTAAAVSTAFQEHLAQGAQLLLATGGNALDPFDPMLGGLAAIDARMEAFGAPAHPGSLFWLAYTPAAVPIFGVASCGMFSKATSVDLLLPAVFAGERLAKPQIAALWEGGLLNKTMAFRFPSYETPAGDEG